jgi:adenylate kinase
VKSRIVLLGPPASGKGTQAELLSRKFGIPAASTGAILREERARGTAIGTEADSYTSRGMFFPDDLALRVVRQWLDGHWDQFILDGFPRTFGQAVAFDRDLAANGSSVELVIHLALSDSAVRERAARRVTCTRCGATFSSAIHGVKPGDRCPACGAALEKREDDSEAAIDERLAQHRRLTAPVIEHYRAAGCLREVDSGNGRERVFAEICDMIEEKAFA